MSRPSIDPSSQAELGNYTSDQLVDLILERLGNTLRPDDLVAAWSPCF